MGRRKPQQRVLEQEAEIKQEGIELPFYGFPADSGHDINFATRLCADWGDSEIGTPPEWETLYSKNLGKRTVCHQRSRKTGRARSKSLVNVFGHELGSVTKAMVAFKTMTAASSAHTITAERRAMRKLKSHLNATQWRTYVLTGMFTEPSRRSKLYYIFRRVAPTIVSRICADEDGIYLRPFLTLCMHPVGYTAHSGTGCMCPTDDVIAHLLLMRSDEHLYWKKSVQHQVGEAVSML